MARKTIHCSNALDDFSFTATYLGALARADTLVITPRWSVFADGGRYSLTGKFLPGKPLRKPDDTLRSAKPSYGRQAASIP